MYIDGRACFYSGIDETQTYRMPALCILKRSLGLEVGRGGRGGGRSGLLGPSYDRPRKIVSIDECSLFAISMKRKGPDPHETTVNLRVSSYHSLLVNLARFFLARTPLSLKNTSVRKHLQELKKHIR